MHSFACSLEHPERESYGRKFSFAWEKTEEEKHRSVRNHQPMDGQEKEKEGYKNNENFHPRLFPFSHN